MRSSVHESELERAYQVHVYVAEMACGYLYVLKLYLNLAVDLGLLACAGRPLPRP